MMPHLTRITMATSLLALAWLGRPDPVHGQTVDQGTFRLSVGGQPVGTEEFVIQRTGSGAAQVTLARGTVTLRSGATVTTHLQVTGPSLTVYRYSVKVEGQDERTITVARTGDRLQARTVAPWGEELREYRATEATLLLDQDIAHHHFLLEPLLEEPPASIHVVAPLSESERSLSGVQVSSDMRPVGGEPTDVRIITWSGGREAWFDASGTLVRVADPASGWVAEREP